MNSPIRFIVQGRVQGVGYRAWAESQARRLGLHGWVRNRRDGSVEILAHGTAEALDTFEQLCRVGPHAAAVTSVRREAGDEMPAPGFTQRETY